MILIAALPLKGGDHREVYALYFDKAQSKLYISYKNEHVLKSHRTDPATGELVLKRSHCAVHKREYIEYDTDLQKYFGDKLFKVIDGLIKKNFPEIAPQFVRLYSATFLKFLTKPPVPDFDYEEGVYPVNHVDVTGDHSAPEMLEEGA